MIRNKKIKNKKICQSGKSNNPYKINLNGELITAFPSLPELYNILFTISLIQKHVSYIVFNKLYEKFINDVLINSENMEPTFKNPNFFQEMVLIYKYHLPENSWNIPLGKEEIFSSNWEKKKDIIIQNFPIYLNEERKIMEYPLLETQKFEMQKYLLSTPLMLLLYVDKFKDLASSLELYLERGKKKKSGEQIDLGTLFFFDDIHIFKIVTNIIKMNVLNFKRRVSSIPLGFSIIYPIDPNLPLPPSFMVETGVGWLENLHTIEKSSIIIIRDFIKFLHNKKERNEQLLKKHQLVIIKVVNFVFNTIPDSWVWECVLDFYQKTSTFLFRYFLYPRVLWAKRINLCFNLRNKFPNMFAANCHLCIKMVNGVPFTILLFLGYNLNVNYAFYIVSGVFAYRIGKATIFWIQAIWQSFYRKYCTNWMDRLAIWLVTPFTIAFNLSFIFFCSQILSFYSPYIGFLCFQYAIILRHIGKNIIESEFYYKYIKEKFWYKIKKKSKEEILIQQFLSKKFNDPLF
jgi:hypothetical protein